MNENLNLVEILKDCPEGMKLYSPAYGELVFDSVKERGSVNPPLYIIRCYDAVVVYTDRIFQCREFKTNGSLIDSITGECILFPSKEQRDWSKFKKPVQIEHVEPKKAYWFVANGGLEQQQPFIDEMQRLLNADLIKEGTCFEDGVFVYGIISESGHPVIMYSPDKQSETMIRHLGTELRIKE